MATRKKPLNKKNLVLLGLATAIVGTYFLAGNKIIAYFKGDQGDDVDQQPEIQPTPTQIAPVIPGVVPTPPKAQVEDEKKLNIYKKLKKGVKGDEVFKMQVILNDILQTFRENGQKDQLIKQDGDFGPGTEQALIRVNGKNSPYYKKGYTTLNDQRINWAYFRGQYGKQYPSSLVGSSQTKAYEYWYKLGQLKGTPPNK
jgi:hypothetical protein